MRLSLVDPTGYAFNLTCKGCGVEGDSSGKTGRIKEWYADLDGEAFKDYYCEQCVAEMRLISAAARASELFDEDELERFASEQAPPPATA